MNLIDYTIDWHKGEAFEATLFGSFGVVVILLAILSWTLGKTPNTQALLIPLLVVGTIFISSGISGVISNQNTIKQLEQLEMTDSAAFVKAEKERVEGFQSLYLYTKIGAGIAFFLAVLLFFVTHNRHWQAIAIALVLLGLTGLVIDYFSKERADHYYQIILKLDTDE